MSGRAPVYFARPEWRERWRAHLGLAAVVMVAVAGVVATLGAADRSEQAFTRLRSASDAGDVAVNAPEGQSIEATRREVAATKGVAAAAAEVEVFVRPAGRDDLYPDYNLYASAPARARGDVNTPVIVKGRAVDPRHSDEVVLSEALAADLGVTPDDRLPLESVTDAWVDVAYNGGDPGPPDGPAINAKVVGVARTPADFGRWRGIMHFGPGFLARYDGEMRMYRWVEARLGGDVSPRTRAHLSELGGSDEGAGPSIFAENHATRDGLGTIARSLRIVAVVAAVAGAVMIALAVMRLARVTFREHLALRALGWTRRQFMATSVMVFAPAIAVGVVLGLGLGIVLAPHALVGLAGRVDPHPDTVLVDGVIVLGVGVLAVVVGLAAAAAAGQRSRRVSEPRTRPVPRILRLDRPVPAVLGVRRAFTGEAELGGRTSRGATIVLALAVTGTVAALMVSASIGRLQDDPELTGQGGGRTVDSGESLDVYDEAFPRLAADRRVATLVGLHIGFDVRSRGSDITMLAYDRVRGKLAGGVVEGRVPRGRHEVALGPATLDRLGKHVGDRIRLARDGHAARYSIVGSVLFPEGDFSYDDGVAMTTNAAARLVGDVEATANLHQIAFEWADGVNKRRADRELEDAGFGVFTDANALKPARVTNLGEVEDVPRYLAAFLGALALVTLAHALATSARRRSHEAATLRAVGLTSRESGLIVVVQAAAIVVVAMAVGVPVGLLVGDRIWTAIADGAHVVVLTVVPKTSVVLFVGAVALLGIIAAAGPVWRTVRLRTADALRTE